jgi:hypothetical protein
MSATGLQTELLILPDGKVLAHNLTPQMAGLLATVGLSDVRSRGARRRRPWARAAGRGNIRARSQGRGVRVAGRKATR